MDYIVKVILTLKCSMNKAVHCFVLFVKCIRHDITQDKKILHNVDEQCSVLCWQCLHAWVTATAQLAHWRMLSTLCVGML